MQSMGETYDIGLYLQIQITMPPKKRARKAGKNPTMARTAAAAEANIQPVDFDQCMGVQNLVAERAGTREKWERQMEKRMEDSEKLLKEMHQMLQGFVGDAISTTTGGQVPADSGRGSATTAETGQVPVTRGSNSNNLITLGQGPVCSGNSATATIARGQVPTAKGNKRMAGGQVPSASGSSATATLGEQAPIACGSGDTAQGWVQVPRSIPAGQAHSNETQSAETSSAPWPTAEGLLARTGAFEQLPTSTQERVVAFASSSLPVYAQVNQKLRTKIWADEFVDMSAMLQDSAEKRQFALSIQEGDNEESPLVCVTKTNTQKIGSFQRWLKAFEIYMAIYLLQPSKLEQATMMLKYINTVRGVAERGGNWAQYDETFRSLRYIQGWQWDLIHSELWLQAVQPVNVFRGGPTAFRGKASRITANANKNGGGICFAYNKGQKCTQNPCKYRHICQQCGNKHASIKCQRTNTFKASPVAASSTGK